MKYLRKMRSRKRSGGINSQEKHMREKREMDKNKFKKNKANIEIMKEKNLYLKPEEEGYYSSL